MGDDDFEAALKKPNVRIFSMTGRPMKGWLLISRDGYKSETALRAWIEKGTKFAGSLPKK